MHVKCTECLGREQVIPITEENVNILFVVESKRICDQQPQSTNRAHYVYSGLHHLVVALTIDDIHLNA